MLAFSYQDYTVKEEGDVLVSFTPARINPVTINGTLYFYKNRRFVKAAEVNFTVETDTERNENYVVYENKRIYATEYYNPEITAFISL